MPTPLKADSIAPINYLNFRWSITLFTGFRASFSNVEAHDITPMFVEVLRGEMERFKPTKDAFVKVSMNSRDKPLIIDYLSVATCAMKYFDLCTTGVQPKGLWRAGRRLGDQGWSMQPRGARMGPLQSNQMINSICMTIFDALGNQWGWELIILEFLLLTFSLMCASTQMIGSWNKPSSNLNVMRVPMWPHKNRNFI